MDSKIFVINLKHRNDKREHILRQSQALNIPAEIIDAVDGNKLTDHALEAWVCDYPHCALTKGVIGCALSHLNLYRKIVAEGIALALILEDDVILQEDLMTVFHRLKAYDLNDEPRVYLLSSHHYKKGGGQLLVNHYHVHDYLDGSAAHAYILNEKAAKSLYEHLLPVKWEADKWYYFQQLGLVKVSCIVPHLIDTNGAASYSDLFEQRALLIKQRRRYLRRMKACVPFIQKVKKFLWKATKRPFAQKS